MKKKYGILILGILLLSTLFSCWRDGEESNDKVSLSSSFPQVTFSFPVTEEGWYYLSLTVKGKGFRWDSKESSIVLDVYNSEGEWLGDLVLWNPDFTYKLFAGKLEKGLFQVTLKYSGEKSPAEKGRITLDRVKLERINSVPEECLEHYPYLLGYEKLIKVDEREVPYNSVSDLPLFWVCKKDDSKVTYVLYYSNEDGGTGLVPGYLMYSWGRTADIENAFTVDLEDQTMWMRDNETEDTLFQGVTYLGHPLLSVAPTDHGLVTEGRIKDKEDQLLFALPIIPDLSFYTREDYLDYLSWSYLIMEWEMERENKITLENLSDQINTLAPLNYYLYMDLYLDDNCKLGMRVILEDGRVISNATSSLAWDFNGWKRVVLKLPGEVGTVGIKSISFVNLSGEECETKIGKLFYLKDDFTSFIYLISTEIGLDLTSGEERQVIPLFRVPLSSPR